MKQTEAKQAIIEQLSQVDQIDPTTVIPIATNRLLIILIKVVAYGFLALIEKSAASDTK